MAFKAITPIRLYESVTEQIMNLIKNNDLKPGDKLPPERELAEKFSISRGSLREAFRVLESRGMVESKHGGGRFIREINMDAFINTENVILNLEKSSILELIEAREIFEVKIVELAAQRATADDIKTIKRALHQMDEGIDEDDKDKKNGEKIELDTEFHLTIARASHNFVFVNIVRLHLELLKNTRERTSGIPGRSEQIKKEHLDIFTAIEEHNSKKAANAMRNHLKQIRKNIVLI